MQDIPPAPDAQETPPPSPPSQQPSPNRVPMLLLAYLGIFALIPLLVEKEDSEVQWHAKHGLVLLLSWIVLGMIVAFLYLMPIVGWILAWVVYSLMWVMIFIVHVVAIIKALKGERLIIPGISDYADRW